MPRTSVEGRLSRPLERASPLLRYKMGSLNFLLPEKPPARWESPGRYSASMLAHNVRGSFFSWLQAQTGISGAFAPPSWSAGTGAGIGAASIFG
jgi:hypothetical protein